QKHSGQQADTDRLVGFCLLVRRKVLDDIGLLDEQFGIGNFEDDDFCRRAVGKGYRAVIAVDAFVHHFGHRTFIGAGGDFAALMDENQQKFDAKWKNASEDRCRAQLEVTDRSAPGPATTPCEASDGSTLIQHPGVRPSCRLSLCMIVRDNETTIGPCLESIQPYVDEIVVVDTGSKDSTPKICRQ